MRYHVTVKTTLALAIASLAACSTTPNANLQAAQATYSAASSDPMVVKNAALELHNARQALAESQSLWRNGADKADVDHYAYLAQREAETAQQTARLKEAQEQVSQSGAARNQALLDVRTQQAAQAEQKAQQAQQQTRQLQQQLAKLQGGGGTVLTLGDILFDVNGTELKPGAYGDIARIATFLKQHPERTVTINGYTDSSGSPEYNQKLSRLRADAVRAALEQNGIAANRITARGLGESAPVASNATTAGRQLNRRVDVAISDRNGQTPETGGPSSGSSNVPPAAQ